ncbi:MAG: F-box protein [Parachlamydia sp.]|nr:F-box protein [Parachlamydia sp.]
MSALEPATSNKHPIELSDREGKKARTENPTRLVTDLPMDVLKAVFALLPHPRQLELAPVCRKFRAAINAQRWTVNMDDVATHPVTYLTHWRKVDTVITECRYNEGGFQGEDEWGMEDVVGGVQRLYLATQLQARKIKIIYAEPYGLEPYLKHRKSKPHLFSSATKAVHFRLKAWDKKVMG